MHASPFGVIPDSMTAVEYSPLRVNRGMLMQLDQLQSAFEGMLEEIRAFRELVTDPQSFHAETHFQGEG